MGTLLEQHPSLTELHGLIGKIADYPISVKQLVELAKREKSSKAVVDFYNAFPEDEIFSDQDDLISRTESVEMLHHQTAPREEMHAPEED
ncbi:hypothetical protein HY379_01250 [Candidatus Saccharibacteria bacterium]|nr:hypothetical protein [Candidatus Saccharibacteria bacterium]